MFWLEDGQGTIICVKFETNTLSNKYQLTCIEGVRLYLKPVSK